MSRKGKRLSGAYEGIDREKDYALADALKIVKDAAAKTKFDETVEVAINLGGDPRHARRDALGALLHGLDVHSEHQQRAGGALSHLHAPPDE